MALTTMKELLVTAQKEKYAVGAFEFWSLDSPCGGNRKCARDSTGRKNRMRFL